MPGKGHRACELAAFNQRNRDAWVAGIASRLPAGTRVLDVGAGEGRYRHLFAHCDYQTQDFCQYGGTASGVLAESWEYAPIDYVSDITAIPVPDASFDVLLCTEVLEHVPEPIPALREMARILKDGGQLFLTAPLGSGLHQQPYHYYGGFTPHFYRKFLTELGFEIVNITPNGRFFRLLLQEVRRAGGIIQQHRRLRRWRLLYWLVRLGCCGRFQRLLSRLDDEIPIEEFTVGYHVEARKSGEGR